MLFVLLKKTFLSLAKGWHIVYGKAEIMSFLRLNFIGRFINIPSLNEPLDQV